MKLTKQDQRISLELSLNEAAAIAVVMGVTSGSKLREASKNNINGIPFDVEEAIEERFTYNLYDAIHQSLKQEPEKPEIKIGQIYDHRSGDKYILTNIDSGNKDLFVLICYKGVHLGQSYGSPSEYINEVFKGNEDCFTLLK